MWGNPKGIERCYDAQEITSYGSNGIFQREETNDSQHF